MKLFSTFCVLFLYGVLLSPHSALSEEVRVFIQGSQEVKIASIAPDERVNLIVHIASAGDPVGGIPIALKQQGRDRALAVVHSDDSGIITFKGVPRGVYQVAIALPRRERVLSSAHIGDVKLLRMEKVAGNSTDERKKDSGW